MVIDNVRNVVFFNHFHNGDVLHAASFVRKFSILCGIYKPHIEKIFFAHGKSTSLIKDNDFIQISISMVPFDQKQTITQVKDTLYINTWVGAYFNKFEGIENEVSLRYNMVIYNQIAEAIGFKEFNISIDEALPVTRTVEENYDLGILKNHFCKTVLICNGPGESSQCLYNGDMSGIIASLSREFFNYLFVCTHNISLDNSSNVIYTDNFLIKENGTDLHKIAKFSEKCDVIIGRYSGPMCFAATKNNVHDSNKKFLVFGDRETDTYYNGITLPCKMMFHKFQTIETLYGEICQIIS